ncbi:hypothetical protein AD998_10965 [bacterium 336/3]|nr:hypothetical protein AD998_10965 [bacterium 336/3]
MKYLLTLLVFSFFVFAQAQNLRVLDSLKQTYQTATQDSTKISTLIVIANEYAKNNPDTSIILIKRALEWSKKIDFSNGINQSTHALWLRYFYTSKYILALEHLQTSLQMFERKQDKKNIGVILTNIGLIYNKQGDYRNALDYFQKSIQIQEQIQDKGGLAQNFNNMGVLYDNQKNSPLALKYYQKALKIFEEISNKKGVANTSGNIGLIHESQGNYSLALEHYNKSLQMQEEMQDKVNIAISLDNIGIVYQKQNKDALALQYYEKASKIQEETGDKWGLTYSWNGIAQVYQKQKKYDKSIEYGQKGLEIAKEIKALAEVKLLSETLYHTYKLYGNNTKALEYHEIFKQINDSLFTIEKVKAIADLENRTEIAKKDREMILLTKENEKKLAEKSFYNYTISGVLFTMFVIVFFIWRNNKVQKILNQQLSYQKQQTEIKNEALQASEEELRQNEEELRTLNNHLEVLVEERTRKLLQTNQKLNEYAFFNAHKLRAPIATILGLYEILGLDNTTEDREFIFSKIKETIIHLDQVVRQSQNLLNELED